MRKADYKKLQRYTEFLEEELSIIMDICQSTVDLATLYRRELENTKKIRRIQT